jgi:hypothetical protein
LNSIVLFDAPANSQSYTITLPTTLTGALAGQFIYIGRSPLDTSLSTTYAIQTGLNILGTIGTSTPTSSILEFVITSASGGSLVWEMVGQRLSAGSNISITGTTDNTIISATGIPPATTITQGAGITVVNPSPGNFQILNDYPAVTLTAGANMTTTQNSTNNFTVATSVPQFGLGTTSSSNTLYETATFGSANVAVSLTSALTQSGMYMFQFNVSSGSTTSPVYPAPGQGAIQFYLTGNAITGQAGSGQYISGYDLGAVSGICSSTKQSIVSLTAGQTLVLNIRAFDVNNNNVFTNNIGVEVKCFYLGAFGN